MRNRASWMLVMVTMVAACGSQQPAQPAPAATPQPAPMSAVDRGKYLVNAMACDDCHTPLKFGPNGPEPDMTRRLMGHPETDKIAAGPKLDQVWFGAFGMPGTAFAGPWGISFAANLTSDPNTGIGQDLWTEDLFVKAIREGKHMGTSRTILPPMPWPAFRNLNDEDLKAIFAFLRTVPPISNHVPEPIPPAAP